MTPPGQDPEAIAGGQFQAWAGLLRGYFSPMTIALPPLETPLDRLIELGHGAPLGTRYLVRGYRSKEGRVCDFLLATMDYRDVACTSLEQLRPLTAWAVVLGCGEHDVTEEIAEQALAAVRKEWLRATREGPRLRYAMPEPGFLLHLRTNCLYLSGVLRGTRELSPAPPRRRPRSAFSRARHWIERQAMAGRWRHLKLGRDNWQAVEIGDLVIPRDPGWDPSAHPGEEIPWTWHLPQEPVRWSDDDLDAALAAAGL